MEKRILLYCHIALTGSAMKTESVMKIKYRCSGGLCTCSLLPPEVHQGSPLGGGSGELHLEY